jgi:hypothetical protein
MNAQLFNDPMVSGVDLMSADMATQLQPAPLHLAPVGAKAVELDFDGGCLSSDAGIILLKDIDDQLGLTRALAAVLSDRRDARRIHFTPEDLLKQRVFQIAAGYEDANDATTLRDDPILTLLLERLPASGAPWPHNRHYRALKTTSHAPNSPAWCWCCWSNRAPPMTSPPRSSCSMSMTPRTVSMANKNTPAMMAIMVAIVLCRSTCMRASRDA